MKDFKSEAGAPELQLSFVITSVPKKKGIGEGTDANEMAQIGMSILRLLMRKRLNMCSSGAGESWKCT